MEAYRGCTVELVFNGEKRARLERILEKLREEYPGITLAVHEGTVHGVEVKSTMMPHRPGESGLSPAGPDGKVQGDPGATFFGNIARVIRSVL